MFTQERTTYSGKMYTVDNVLNSPPPIQKNIPILIGGSGEKVALKIAAKHADISHLVTTDLNELDHKLSVLEKYCEAVGRDYHAIRKGAFIRVGSLAPKVTMEEVVKRIDDYKSRGIGLVTFLVNGPGPSVLNDVQLISRDVLPRFRKRGD